MTTIVVLLARVCVAKLLAERQLHNRLFFRLRKQGARRRLLTPRRVGGSVIRQLLEAHRRELRVTDLDLAALVVVSAAEGIAMSASDEVFGDRLAKEVSALLNLYLTGEEPR